MAVPATQSPNKELLDQFQLLPQHHQKRILHEVTNAGLQDPDAIKAFVSAQMAASINQLAARNEASLVQGGYDPRVAASAGTGVDPKAAEEARQNFAMDAARAVQHKQTLDAMASLAPELTQQDKQTTYARVAGQQGTTPGKIAVAAEAEKQAIQGAVGGAVAAVTSQAPSFAQLVSGVAISKELRAMNAGLNAQAETVAMATGQGQQRDRDSGIV